jgi:hypothetical protein
MHDGLDLCAPIRPPGSWLLRILASMGVLITTLSGQTPTATADTWTGWRLVDGERGFLPSYPEAYTQYWSWGLNRTRWSMTAAFRIKGQFPFARYMRFQTYSSTPDGRMRVHALPWATGRLRQRSRTNPPGR